MKVLVVSVHPDDETLGCGGTLLKHRSNSDELGWLIITNVKQEYGFSTAKILSRNKEIDLVANAYGFAKVYNLGLKPMGLNSESQPELIQSISNVMNEYRPEIVYLINRSDAHSDHRFAFEACFACTKPFRYPFIKKVLMYECLSETELAAALPENSFIPNSFTNITSFIDDKLKIMNIYASELSEPPFPRSIDNMKALASYRGATVGVMYAEAFVLLRNIE